MTPYEVRISDWSSDVCSSDLDRAVLACRVVDGEADPWCRRCGCEGIARDTVTRLLAHEPLGWRPTTLEVTVRRYRCTGCRHVWRQRAEERRVGTECVSTCRSWW